MSEPTNRPWFRAKKHGWGWSFPLTWQGWLVSIVYLVLLAAGLLALRRGIGLPVFLLYVLVITGGHLAICWLKGEKPGWR